MDQIYTDNSSLKATISVNSDVQITSSMIDAYNTANGTSITHDNLFNGISFSTFKSHISSTYESGTDYWNDSLSFGSDFDQGGNVSKSLLLMIDHVSFNTPLTSNYLITNVDMNDSSSYSGSGTTWTDLSGNGNNFTIQGGAESDVGTDSIGGSTIISLINTNSSSATKFITGGPDLSGTPAFTVIAGVRYRTSTSSLQQRIVSSGTDGNYILGHHAQQTDRFFDLTLRRDW
jgi:hypothetical protein